MSHEALTRLTRLAQRQPQARRWLQEAFSGRLAYLAEPAIEVAAETGDPIGSVLAEKIRQEPKPEICARIVDLCEDDLHALSVPTRLALVATRQLLDFRHAGRIGADEP